jgi:hypothetical protein
MQRTPRSSPSGTPRTEELGPLRRQGADVRWVARTQPLLQRLDPVGDGRGCDFEVLRSPLEAAGADDRREGREMVMVGMD